MGTMDNEKERFVSSAAMKKMSNQRKRKPNMCMAALLECTLRRVSSELARQCEYVCEAKRRKSDVGDAKNVVQSFCSEGKVDEFTRRWEKAQTKSNFNDSVIDQSTFTMEESLQENGPRVGPKSEIQDQTDFEAFLQSLSDFPNFEIEDLDDLLRELDFNFECTVTTQSCKEEVEDLLNNSDPFLPGILEILCS